MTRLPGSGSLAPPSHHLQTAELLERKIYLIRGHKVMLDTDLAALYAESLRSQVATSKSGRGRRRYAPLVFTEQGVAMLSTVLKSERAILVNIAIMRTFLRLREMLATHKELAQKLVVMERKYDKRFKIVFDAIRELMNPPRRLEGSRRGYFCPESDLPLRPIVTLKVEWPAKAGLYV